MKKWWFLDLVIFLVSIILGIIVTLAFKVKPFISMIFFFVFPTIYMFIMKKYHYKKIISTAFFGSLVMTYLNVILVASGAWHVPNEQMIFKFKLFGVASLDYFFWFFALFLFILIFYEYFVEKDRTRNLSKNFKWFLVILIATILIVLIMFFLGLLNKVRYAYLIYGIVVLLMPIVYLFIKRPKFIKKFFYVAMPFFIILSIHEYTALISGQWIYLGEYIKLINILGVTVPFEEIFFFSVITSSACLSYYKIFFDDMK